MVKLRKLMSLGLACSLSLSVLAGCGAKAADEQVIIYSNADDEAITAMSNALDANGYEGRYIFETFGTSELGGKLQSAQEQNGMFLPLEFDVNTLEAVPDYTAPITSQEGAIILNTEVLAEAGLDKPASLQDLADPKYAGQVAVTDIQSSSTAWLMIQALVSAYGEDGAQEVLHGIYENAGDHIESSGSAPLKLCRAGEVAIGFGLRHQAVADKADGLPIDFVDPTEGNFSLTESVAVLDKGDATNPEAMKMAQCIIENGRAALQQTYPNPLYEGEGADSANKSAYPKTFDQPLTFELFSAHQALSEAAKP